MFIDPHHMVSLTNPLHNYKQVICTLSRSVGLSDSLMAGFSIMTVLIGRTEFDTELNTELKCGG